MDGRTAEILKRKLLALFADEPEVQKDLERFIADRPDADGEVVRFLGLLVPLVRRNRLESAARHGHPLAGVPVRVLQEWFDWMDSMDPYGARILDLRYFARLRVRDIAAILHTRPEAIRRELQQQRKYIKIYLEH